MSSAPKSKNATLLCLLCRGSGHLFGGCPYLTPRDRDDEDGDDSKLGIHLPPDLEETLLSAAFSPPATSPSTSSSSSSSPPPTQVLCARCHTLDLNITTLFTSSTPFTLSDKSSTHANRAKRKVRRMHTLGPIRTLELHSTCALCRIIFDITHLQFNFTKEELGDLVSNDSDSTSDAERQLMIVPAWTMNRVEREVRWKGYEKGEGPYARCIYTTLKPKWDDWSWGTTLVDNAIDALGIENVEGALGVKPVDPQRVDYEAVNRWLGRCGELHQGWCQPQWSDDLTKIKLVDVESRRIVPYPDGRCEYLALSYVWGGAMQAAYRPGDVLPLVPATIEDAMTVTRALGKRYLWVDSLCINQGDKEEKAVQIALMSAIYSSAWATIVATTGQSAYSGLPRVSSHEGVIPQSVYKTGGIRLLSLMPTLAQQLSHSPWVKRAWTYQEGMLSPRRIFFTKHQMYFECNAFQCCESLDEDGSPFHSVTGPQRQFILDRLVDAEIPEEYVFGLGVLRDPLRQVSADNAGEDTLLGYMKLVYAYTSKKMTNDEDSINAFSAVLTRLEETHYKRGFIHGLPMEDLPRALLWTHIAGPRRRGEFPAWSWAGWEAAVKPILVKGARVLERAKQPPLRVWRAGDSGEAQLVYEFNPVQWADSEGSSSGDTDEWESESDDEEIEETDASTERDPVREIARTMHVESPPSALNIEESTILIEGLVIRLQFQKTRPQSWPDSTRDHEPQDVDENLSADSQQCIVRFPDNFRDHQLRIYGENARTVIDERHGKPQDFLLLAREHDGPELWHAMLLVDWDDDGAARRVAVASLGVDWFKPGLLNPRRRMFKLI